MITIALSISFTIKCRLFARKEWLAKRNQATLISLWSQGRAISADIGRQFRPLCLVWWALFIAYDHDQNVPFWIIEYYSMTFLVYAYTLYKFIGNLDIFPLIFKTSDIFSINKLSLILEIIGQCDNTIWYR